MKPQYSETFIAQNNLGVCRLRNNYKQTGIKLY